MGWNAGLESHEQPGDGSKKLIEAVVASVDDNEDPPPVLRLSWMSRKYSALPNAGGVLDQEYAMLHQMDVVSNVHDTLTRFRGYRGKSIHDMSMSERRLIRSLRDMDLI